MNEGRYSLSKKSWIKKNIFVYISLNDKTIYYAAVVEYVVCSYFLYLSYTFCIRHRKFIVSVTLFMLSTSGICPYMSPYYSSIYLSATLNRFSFTIYYYFLLSKLFILTIYNLYNLKLYLPPLTKVRKQSSAWQVK